MRKYIIWLTTEYKRAACRLPLLVGWAVILAVVILTISSMIAFCTLKIKAGDILETQKLNVGYVADDDMITNMAISYVSDMESVKDICVLSRVENEEIGKELLKNGEISALVVLPTNVIGEIVSGSNAHGRLYLNGNDYMADLGSGFGNVAVMLFGELERAGMGMLATAQAEIYATAAVFGDNTELEEMYGDIDRFNLVQVTGREKLFSYKTVSLTENDTFTVYYASAIVTVYMLLFGIFLGGYLKRSRKEQLFAKRRLGIGTCFGLFSRYAGGLLQGLLLTALPLLLLFVPKIRENIGINLGYAGIMAILMATIYMVVFNALVYEVAENRQAAVVGIGFNAILQAYASGCIIPSVLLPVKISKLGGYLPAAYIKKAVRMFLTGREDELLAVAEGLLAWCLITFVVTVIIVKACEEKPLRTRKLKTIKPKHYHIPSLLGVVFRRFVHKKSIWVCLIIILAVSIAIVRTERTSKTTISVAFFDEGGEYGKTLEDYEGLVQFVEYGSIEEVKKAVLKGEVECGYIIPKGLADSMVLQMSNGLVTVYQDDDSVATPITNEILYEKLFRAASLKWYGDYISEIDNDARKLALGTFEDKLNQGVTFDIDIEYLGKRTEGIDTAQQKATYPVWAVAILIVAICGIYGIIQVVSDERKKRFYRCKKLVIYSYTILIPILFGVVTGIIIVAIIANTGQYSY